MLHSPTAWVGFAGGERNRAVRVVLFLALGLGPSPGTRRRLQVLGSPAYEPQVPDSPGRKRAVSAAHAEPALGPAETARSSPSRPHTQDAIHRDLGSGLSSAARRCCVTSVARTGNQPLFRVSAHDYRTWDYSRNGTNVYPFGGFFRRKPGLGKPRRHAGKCSSPVVRGGTTLRVPGLRLRN